MRGEMMTTDFLKKSACFTDIHFGRKNNSEIHNQDCLDFIDWFCGKVEKNKEIDHVIFLGDWHENRNSINGLTLEYSYEGAKKLNDLGMPVFIIVGNHDLYYKTSRDVFTTTIFESFENIVVVSQPTVFDEIGPKGTLICPYLFHDEYDKLLQYFNVPTWFGHFEFKGFVLTGDTYKLEHGPDPEDFKKINKIFCGHFHKRQNSGNVYYMGNVFPADFGDANDDKRGMMVYDHVEDDITFTDWDDCPRYVKCTLSDVLDGETGIPPKSYVWCLVDMPLTHTEKIELREYYLETQGVREIKFEEIIDDVDSNEVDGVDISEVEFDTADKAVPSLIGRMELKKMSSELLIKIYKEL